MKFRKDWTRALKTVQKRLRPRTWYSELLKLNDFNEMSVPAARTQLLKLTNVASSFWSTYLTSWSNGVPMGFDTILLNWLTLTVRSNARTLSIPWTRVYWSWISMILLKDFRTFYEVSWFFRGQTSEMDGRWSSAPWLARCVCEDGWIPSHFTDAVLLFPGFAQEQFMLIFLAEKVFSGSPSANWNTSCGGSQATWCLFRITVPNDSQR